MEHQGPFTLTHSEQVCSFCDYLKSKMLVHRRIGTNDYSHSCMHPALIDPELPPEAQVRLKENGRYIGMTDETPHWCPFLQGNAPMIDGRESTER